MFNNRLDPLRLVNWKISLKKISMLKSGEKKGIKICRDECKRPGEHGEKA